MDSTIQKLRETGTQVYKDVLKGVHDAVLVDFPNHANVGDSAIWAGEKQILKELGVTIRYQCDFKTYNRQKLAAAGRGPVLIHGGGNFGDVWPDHEAFRLQIVRDFPDRKVVQLPQSVFYSSTDAMEKSAEVFRKHSDFMVLTRDAQSQQVITGQMGLRGMLCPDSAFFLQLERTQKPSVDVLCLKRTDHETAGEELSSAAENVPCVDWLEDIAWPGLKVLSVMETWHTHFPNKLNCLEGLMQTQYDTLAWRRIQKGLAMLSRAKVIVTDRLHAHILCLLCGIPHVLIDNNYGKLRSYYEAWTGTSAITYWAKTFEEGIRAAEKLAAGMDLKSAGSEL